MNRDRARFRHNNRHDIAVVTNLIVGENAVVADDLAEAVHAGHIFRRQHADHAGDLLGGAGVNRGDARVDEIGIRRRSMEHVGELQVVRELRLAGDLGVSIIAPAWLFCVRVHRRNSFRKFQTRILKGCHLKAQGCEERATLGTMHEDKQPRRGCGWTVERRHNPFGVENPAGGNPV